jgi:3-phenylpropionate/trans-cinnamate dioxygenase ferredoxin reductase subunit
MDEMLPEQIAIVGASLAGARAAEALRQRGFEGEILLIGEEPLRPYERPPLSKEALLDDNARPQWVHSEAFYADNGIELLTGCRVVSLKRPLPRQFKLQLSDGGGRQVDTVLLATGGRPRELAGCPAGGILHYVRTWEDSLRLRGSLKQGARVVVIGSGFIGAEVASTALARGCHVSIVEALPRLFPSIPSAALAEEMARRFTEAGAVPEVGRSVAKVTREGHGARVYLADGTELAADLVVAGIGIEMRVELAAMIGAEVGRGVLVDPQFRTTIPGLYAAGDVCIIRDDRGGHSHFEHWKAAQEQGVAAALSMLRIPVPQLSAPWCWSDQLGQRIEVAGTPRTSDKQVIRRDGAELCVFHLREGRLVGIVSLNAMRAMRMGMKLLEKAAQPDPTQLADPTVPVNKVRELA